MKSLDESLKSKIYDLFERIEQEQEDISIGTEKQIKYAEDIRRRMYKALVNIFEESPSVYVAIMEAIEKFLNDGNSEEDFLEVIELAYRVAINTHIMPENRTQAVYWIRIEWNIIVDMVYYVCAFLDYLEKRRKINKGGAKNIH